MKPKRSVIGLEDYAAWTTALWGAHFQGSRSGTGSYTPQVRHCSPRQIPDTNFRPGLNSGR